MQKVALLDALKIHAKILEQNPNFQGEKNFYYI